MMRFIATADTDIGNTREANQDSLLIRHAQTPAGEVLLCVVCDGMGGLSKGELASATVVRAFSDWFDRELSGGDGAFDLRTTAAQWTTLLDDANRTLSMYGERHLIHLGTTISGILFAGGRYLLCHVGDSRIYHIDRHACQLTEDQTLVGQEVRAGRLTKEQARRDTRRGVLLQCVGASASVKPQMIVGKAKTGVYLLCSDGFYHKTTAGEMSASLAPDALRDRRVMHARVRRLIDLAKSRGEKDNLSAILVRARTGKRAGAGRRRDGDRIGDR